MEEIERDKPSSLLRYGINYIRKKSNSSDPDVNVEKNDNLECFRLLQLST